MIATTRMRSQPIAVTIYDDFTLRQLGRDLDSEIRLAWWRMQENRRESRLALSRNRMEEYAERAGRARYALVTLLRLRRCARLGVIR